MKPPFDPSLKIMLIMVMQLLRECFGSTLWPGNSGLNNPSQLLKGIPCFCLLVKVARGVFQRCVEPILDTLTSRESVIEPTNTSLEKAQTPILPR